MIKYDEGRWHVFFIFRRDGSILPRAALFGLVASVLSVLLNFGEEWLPNKFDRQSFGLADLTEGQIWSSATIALGILLGFRTRQAWGRFWEGTTLLHQMRGEWFDAVSCLMAFSRSAIESKPDDVEEFRSVLVRLASLMHGCACEEIKDTEDDSETFDVIDVHGLDKEVLQYLADCKTLGFNRVEVLLHMLQVLVTYNLDSGVLKIAPPILSRVYQQFSRGVVNLHNAMKITDTQFPFPYSQLITTCLLLHLLLTPMFICSVITNKWFAALVSFLPVFGMWCLNFTAAELESPFGDDSNDLPLKEFQGGMNSSLIMLTHSKSDMLPQTSQTCRRGFLDFKHIGKAHSKNTELPRQSLFNTLIESAPVRHVFSAGRNASQVPARTSFWEKVVNEQSKLDGDFSAGCGSQVYVDKADSENISAPKPEPLSVTEPEPKQQSPTDIMVPGRLQGAQLSLIQVSTPSRTMYESLSGIMCQLEKSLQQFSQKSDDQAKALARNSEVFMSAADALITVVGTAAATNNSNAYDGTGSRTEPTLPGLRGPCTTFGLRCCEAPRPGPSQKIDSGSGMISGGCQPVPHSSAVGLSPLR